MSKLSKVLVAVAAIAGVVVVAMVLSRRPGKGPESDLQVSVSEPTPAATVETNRSSFFIKRARQRSSPSHPRRIPVAVFLDIPRFLSHLMTKSLFFSSTSACSTSFDAFSSHVSDCAGACTSFMAGSGLFDIRAVGFGAIGVP